MNTSEQYKEYIDSAVEYTVDSIGANIETIGPILPKLDNSTDEYLLLKKIWENWTSYIEG